MTDPLLCLVVGAPEDLAGACSRLLRRSGFVVQRVAAMDAIPPGAANAVLFEESPPVRRRWIAALRARGIQRVIAVCESGAPGEEDAAQPDRWLATLDLVDLPHLLRTGETHQFQA